MNSVRMKFLILACFLTYLLISSTSAVLAQERQKPLSDYYSISKRSLPMAPWLMEKADNFTDYDRFIGFGLLEVDIGNQNYALPNVLSNFLDVTFAPNNEYTPYAVDITPVVNFNDYNIRPIGNIYSKRGKGSDYIQAFNKDYPWIVNLVNSESLAPRSPAINKWNSPVTISLGFPNDLLPQGAVIGENKGVFKQLNKGTFPKRDGLVKDAVMSLSSELSSLTGLSVRWLDGESAKDGRIRIVLTDEYDERKSVYRLYRASVSTLSAPDKVTEEEFRRTVEMQMDTAIKFTPSYEAGLDGYFIPDDTNHIKFAVCYIWSGHSDVMIKALVSECLFRSLGLPDIFADKHISLLMNWNKAADLKSSRSDDEVPRGPSSLDKLFLRMLYEPGVKVGMTPVAVNSYYQSIFFNQAFGEE